MTKGQILNLDLMISLIIIALLLGISIHSMERHQNLLLDDLEYTALSTLGKRAGQLLVANPTINCSLVEKNDTTDKTKHLDLLNTYDSEVTITKAQLGIGDKIKCEIKGETNHECNDTPSTNDRQVHVEERKMYDCKGLGYTETRTVNTAEFKDSTLANTKGTITLTVWR